MLTSDLDADGVMEIQMTHVEALANYVQQLPAATDGTSTRYRTFGGCGSGRACTACGAVIPMNRMEIEVKHAAESGMDPLVFHVRCFSAWLETVAGSES